MICESCRLADPAGHFASEILRLYGLTSDSIGPPRNLHNLCPAILKNEKTLCDCQHRVSASKEAE